MPSLLLLRHAASTWNLLGRWQGQADPPLSEAGERDTRAAADRMAAGISFGQVISSDLERARRTAEIIAESLGTGDVAIDARLRERDVGQWSGLTTAEIEQRWPGAVGAWRQGLLPGPPGGEDDDALRTRALAALENLTRAHPGGDPLLVVTHGGLIRAVELASGATPSRPANLCGRWVEHDGPDGSVWRAGDIADPLEPRPAEACR